MLKRFSPILAVALSVGVMSVAIGDSHARLNTLKSRFGSKKKSQTEETSFAVTGKYSGRLDGKIKVGKRTMFVTDKTILYRAGEGRIDRGHYVGNKTAVYAVGSVGETGAYEARYIIIQSPNANRNSSRLEKAARTPRGSNSEEEIPQ